MDNEKAPFVFDLFSHFFNGVYQSNNSGTHLFDSDEVIIEIDSARVDENNLQN